MVQLYDFVTPIVLILCQNMKKRDLSGYILKMENIFVLLNTISLRGLIMESIKDFILTCIYFSLTYI